MSKHRDLTGFRSGRLLVISQAGYRRRADGRNRSMWLCRCDCGNEVVLPQDSIATQSTRSCGCTHVELAAAKYKGPLHGAVRSAYKQYKASAKQRGYAFEIDMATFQALCEKPCHYCGAKPGIVTETPNAVFIRNGLDRVDNTAGYVVENLVPCCTACNLSKGTRTAEYFHNNLSRTLRRRKARNIVWMVISSLFR